MSLDKQSIDDSAVAIATGAEVSTLLKENQRLKAQARDLEQQIAALSSDLTQCRQDLEAKPEQVSHEIAIRLQGVVAETENLINELPGLSLQETSGKLQYLLYTILGLDTVAQTLMGDEYLDECFFTEQSLLPLLYEAVQTFQAVASRRGIQIVVKLEPNASLWNVEISRPHMQQALNNLIHNAVKYSFRSGPDRLRFVRIVGRIDGDQVMLSIENYGVGIRDEEIENDAIFGEGYRGELTRGEYRSGAGMGLSFVKRMIDKHSGHIEVDSRIVADAAFGDVGSPHLTRFTIFIPRKQQPRRSEYADHSVD
jgi:signal transduction histidine kinase